MWFYRAAAWFLLTEQSELICFARDNDLLKQAGRGLFLTSQKKATRSLAESSGQGDFVRTDSGAPFSRRRTHISHILEDMGVVFCRHAMKFRSSINLEQEIES